ncbi:MAG: class I SAM-dependent methyltransferase [Herminiimonas sp.]|nr:class I SAM-dependent methyltransferase [Herminiimonas sp.]
MFWEKKLEDWVDGIRNRAVLPLRVQLWNGRRFDFGTPFPQVTVRIPQASSLAYLLRPSLLNLGRAYVEGKIDIEGKVDQIIRVGGMLASTMTKQPGSARQSARAALQRLVQAGASGDREHTRKIDADAIRYHYDVSNDFYAQWLDPQMVYSCAYFENGDEDLATAQIEKIDHILAKLRLQQGHRLLDIGCGWGALVIRAAQRYGVHCIGVTLSEQQYALACQRVQKAGLQQLVEIRRQDYRDLDGRFDRITSVGMFEHVGLKNLPLYFGKIRALLAEDGVAMNHGITTTNVKAANAAYGAGEFIERYVFPHGELAHAGTVLLAMQEAGLEAVDVENLRRHYARTCAIWSENFDARSDCIRLLVDEKRFRIWRLYLAGCAYAFEQDWIALHQILCVRAGSNAAGHPWSRRYMYG